MQSLTENASCLLQNAFLDGTFQPGAVIILNGEPLEPSVLDAVWPPSLATPACPVLCADGGANLLHTLLTSPSGGARRAPTHIVGDLDSLTASTRAYFVARGASVLERPDQDANDFEKALTVVDDAGGSPVAVLGGMAGRLDQTLANVQQLYCAAGRGLHVVWISGRNLACVLPPGVHVVEAPTGSKCGLLPVAGPVREVRTAGLRWNINGSLAFGPGGLVSSSNETAAARLEVETSDAMLWTVEVAFRGGRLR